MNTASDRIRWQRHALNLLNEVWGKGAKAGLEPLMWRVGASGIAGTACQSDPVQQEESIRAWAALLDIELKEQSTGTGTRLSGFAKEYGTARWADIAISATIDRNEGVGLMTTQPDTVALCGEHVSWWDGEYEGW